MPAAALSWPGAPVPAQKWRRAGRYTPLGAAASAVMHVVFSKSHTVGVSIYVCCRSRRAEENCPVFAAVCHRHRLHRADLVPAGVMLLHHCCTTDPIEAGPEPSATGGRVPPRMVILPPGQYDVVPSPPLPIAEYVCDGTNNEKSTGSGLDRPCRRPCLRPAMIFLPPLCLTFA
jgi:hypothetical protein